MTRYKRKPKPVTNSHTIVYDTREQKPWLFLSKKWPLKRKHLKVGDYSVEGFEDVIAIEKKSGFQELFSNLTGKERPRFERMLKRLSAYPVKLIIVEDEITNLYSVWSAMKRKAPKMKLTPRTIFHWVSKITMCYQIPVVFVPKGWGHDIITYFFEQAIIKAKEL